LSGFSSYACANVSHNTSDRLEGTLEASRASPPWKSSKVMGISAPTGADRLFVELVSRSLIVDGLARAQLLPRALDDRLRPR
jgi:hypothetical protein